MSKDILYAIGEALIDFIPNESGCDFRYVSGFSPALGGAPANVCGAFAKLGGRSQMITQLGDDPFGHKIAAELAEAGIGTQYVSFTSKANTALAFVSLAADGNRTFSFYRNPSADMLLEPSQIRPEWFEEAYALHFCSVELGDTPMKEAHIAAIDYAQKAGALISFDPNLRFPLWPDRGLLHQRVWEFIPKAHILKISDEELEFITGKANIEEALELLFVGNVQLILYTCGGEGARAYTRNAKAADGGQKVHAVDTTGAGDAFAGSILYCLHRDGVTVSSLASLAPDQLARYLAFANHYCAASVQRKGAIASYLTLAEVDF